MNFAIEEFIILFIMVWNLYNCILYYTGSTIFELLYNVVQGNNSGAYRELVTCLRVLQCPLPVTRLEVCSALFWQMLRQFLHRLYIGRWLSSYSGGLFATPYVSKNITLRSSTHYNRQIIILMMHINYYTVTFFLLL